MGYRTENIITSKKQWPKRELLTPGQKNVVNTPSINHEKVYLLPMNIKLGLIRNFVKAMDQNSAGFMYLKNEFPGLSDDKIKKGVFVGPQVRKLKKDVKFEDQLSEVKKHHGNLSKMSLPIFWEIVRQKTIAIWWLILHKAMGCSISAKVHFLVLT